jgi:flagellar assembly protein FliH
MAKNVFRSGEVTVIDGKVNIAPPSQRAVEPVEPEPIHEIEEYSGPTADDLRQEAELFRQDWDRQKEEMIRIAREEADRIVKAAEETAFEEVKRKNDQAQAIRESAETEAQQIAAEAKTNAEEVVREAETHAAEVRDQAYQEGVQRGRDEGFAQGKSEVDRLIDRVHAVLNKTIERRNEILEESEAQVVQLVLTIVKKVVKILSENQRQVVMHNIVQALQKLKHKGDITIRVNTEDLELTSDHAKDLTRKMENVGYVTVLEDSSIEPGGCIIETDFGEIDARIGSQLREIEERILEMVPIKEREKRQ